MPTLIKIRDLSLKYNITTRALTYYEDMGLLRSTYVDGYAYRCYDSRAVARLEQILILRKLDISIKDIMRIFQSRGGEILLEVLRKKSDALDEQILTLKDLKQLILDFINSAEQYDFDNRNDIRLLYEKAHIMENRLDRTLPAKAMEIFKEPEKAPVVSVVELPAVPMARCSNSEMEAFTAWWRALEKQYRPLHSGNLSWYDFYAERVCGLYALPYGFNGDCPYEIFDFPGGLYATATFLDDPYPYAFESNSGYLYKWIAESEDYAFHLTENTPQARFIMWRDNPSMGKEQPQVAYYVPIDRKSKQTHTISAVETEAAKFPIELPMLEAHGEMDMRITAEGVQLRQQGQNGYCRTPQSFSLPLRIDLTAKTDSTNIRLSFGEAVIVFNWGVAPNSMVAADVLEGGHYRFDGIGYLPPNEYADISWIVQRDFMAVAVNNQVRLFRRDFPYIRQLAADPDLAVNDCVRVHTAFGAAVTVRALTVHQW